MTYKNIEDKVFQLAMTVCEKSPETFKKESYILRQDTTFHITPNVKVEHSVLDNFWIIVNNKRFETSVDFFKKIDDIYDLRYKGGVEEYQNALDVIENDIEAYSAGSTLKMG